MPTQYANAFSKAQDGLMEAIDVWKSCGKPCEEN